MKQAANSIYKTSDNNKGSWKPLQKGCYHLMRMVDHHNSRRTDNTSKQSSTIKEQSHQSPVETSKFQMHAMKDLDVYLKVNDKSEQRINNLLKKEALRNSNSTAMTYDRQSPLYRDLKNRNMQHKFSILSAMDSNSRVSIQNSG